MLLVLLNPNLGGVKTSESAHASSTVLGRIVWERVELREGLPGNKWEIFADETSVQCDEKDSEWDIRLLFFVLAWNISNIPIN